MNDFSDLLYIVAAIAIFGMLLVSASQSMIRNNLVTVGNEEEYTAVSLANSIIEEARVLQFDESNSCTLIDLTLPNDLGTDSGENYISLGRSNFNDFDDYDGLNITEATDSGVFNIQARVYYVTQLDPGTEVFLTTLHKRMDVTVSGVNQEGNVTLSYVKSCR
jgi:type II secretory pathway pseudopilin PulG